MARPLPPRVTPRKTPEPVTPPVTITVPTQVETVVKPSHLVLAANTRQLLRLWESSDSSLKKILYPSLLDMGYKLRAAALEAGGFGKTSGDSAAALKAKTLFITGKAYDGHSCTKVTVAGTRCKNKPLVGQEHCHVIGHATRDERERSRQDSARWTAHMQLMLDGIGLREVYNALGEAITATNELSKKN